MAKENIRELLIEFCELAKSRIAKGSRSQDFSDLLSLNPDVTELKYETLYLGKKDADKEIMTASQYEMRSGQSLMESELIDSGLGPRKEGLDWRFLKRAKGLRKRKKLNTLRTRETPISPNIHDCARFQNLIDSNDLSKEELIELLPTAPYAKFNIEKFARVPGHRREDVFSYEFAPDRISVLSTPKLKELKLCSRDFAGECFAKKKKSHGLFSESDIYIWMRKELSPFTLLYTAGHELIHYQQIKNSIEAEKRALQGGGVSFAKALNYYGNFLGSNNRSVDSIRFDLASERKPLYGYVDRMVTNWNSPIIKELRGALKKSDAEWDKALVKYGSLFGYMTPNSAGTRVKALQEVLPALENAKNILFAQELGLIVHHDATQAALPASNAKQVKQYRELIETAAKAPKAKLGGLENSGRPSIPWHLFLQGR